MQKLTVKQSLSQKLSPQQIQFIKLLQIPTAELDSRVEEELESNPALEEGREKDKEEDGNDDYDEMDYSETSLDSIQDSSSDVNIDDYLNRDDVAGYKMQGDGNYQEEERDMPISSVSSLTDELTRQLGYLRLDERMHAIGMQLIGSIDDDGYIRRDIDAIVNDLAFIQNIQTDRSEVEKLLRRIQQFDPAGIGARDLQECLLIQLKRLEKNRKEKIEQEKAVENKEEFKVLEDAIHIISMCFEEFKKKHFKKIQRKLNLSEDELRAAMGVILKLNPKPGGSGSGMVKVQYVIPDFTIKYNNGKLDLSLNSRNAPQLHISRNYTNMLESYDKSDKKDKKLKQEVSFVKQKLDAAKWFIDAIKQRQQTLLKTMSAIMEYQREFFLEGEDSKLRPMILKDIANEIGMDISTVSRVANSKSVQTDFGVFPLKYFFSESIQTDSGEDVSSKEVKAILKKLIEDESKRKPYSDDKLEKLLRARGYQIARRTVAKYREQLNIPVARLRKEV
ncbi:RNA polymerase factor sigma-54 [Bernardetia sp.]|uniref:RNA polymerase factor sigma-54 n=1 Tax=Bernardetia sp. TaxID=1937974 RepID=UPI0025C320FB|nr:RNA polymerase factor sigma-54 [Bernardetia sp.]